MKVAKYDGVIQKLTEKVKNEWTPCPMYIMSDVITLINILIKIIIGGRTRRKNKPRHRRVLR